MKKLLKTVCFSLAFCLTLGACGCKKENYATDYFFFNTQIHIELQNAQISSQTDNEIRELLKTLEKEFSVSEKDSTVSKINHGKKNQPIPLTALSAEILGLAKSCYDFTDGKFNPAVYPLVKLWQFSDGYPVDNFILPTQERIDGAMQNGATDFNSIIINAENDTVTKLSDDGGIDLGGIVKGYACDEIAKILKENGVKKGYVSVGGSSLALLTVNSLGIRHPRRDGSVITVNSGITDVSVSSSGDYERFYELEGKRYSHIIDGATGKPADTGVQSATVIMENGGIADALSTALCLCEYSSSGESPLTLLMNKIILRYPTASIFALVENQEGKYLVTNKTVGVHFVTHDDSYQVVRI